MPEVVSACKGPKEAYESLVDKGVELAAKPLIKVFHQAFYAGCYIGFGGMLSMVVAGGLDDAAQDNPTIQTFVFAALFPVNLLIILLTGGVLFTGTSATVAAAVYERKTHWVNIPRTFAVSWLGNLLGGVIFALLIQYCDMNVGLTAKLAAKVAEKKIKKDFVITFIKGIGCNWLVCMAVFLSGQAQDMTGKMVGIWFPISCFVAIGFEHIPANMFMMPLGLLAGADVTVGEMVFKNFLPVTLGNAFAGSIIVAVGYSFAFGRLGANAPSHLPVRRCSREDLGADDFGADDFALPPALDEIMPPPAKEVGIPPPHVRSDAPAKEMGIPPPHVRDAPRPSKLSVGSTSAGSTGSGTGSATPSNGSNSSPVIEGPRRAPGPALGFCGSLLWCGAPFGGPSARHA